MHILYLTDEFPFPLTSGMLRHYHLVRELSGRHRITLFSRVGPRFEPDHAEAMQGFAERIQTFADTRGQNPIGKWISFRAGERTSGAMGQAIRDLLREDPFQVVVTVKRCVGAIAGDLSVPVVADICDAASMRIRGRLNHAPWIESPRLVASYFRMKSLEWRTVRRAQHCVFISPRDRSELLGEETSRTSIIPNGVDALYWKRTAPLLGRDQVVFTGAMDYPPNVDAGLRLIGPIMDRVRARCPDAGLSIVGRDPNPALLQAAGRNPGVWITGFVEDVRPYLDRASVFCAPLRFGAGAQNKVLEALSMEVPCVVSPLAAEGLRIKPGIELPLAIAPDDDAIAEEVIRRLDQAAAGNAEPHTAGRRFVQEHFQWSRHGADLSLILEDLAGVPSRLYATGL